MNGENGYGGAALLLPVSLRGEIKLPEHLKNTAEEIRLRAGRRASVLLADGETVTGTRPVKQEELEAVVEIVTGASFYAVRSSVKAGYLTAKGGYRIGLCGSAVVKNGVSEGLREISSLAIRIPGEMRGVGKNVMKSLVQNGKFKSTLIVSPPGNGKTTLLRDCVRILSDGDESIGIKGTRVALADERGEIAGLYRGVPQRDVGARTDVLDECPKAQAVMQLLKTMNPQIIALDEITAAEDIAAIQTCANCGVALIATAHGESIADLSGRKMYADLLKRGIFKYAVFIRKTDGGRRYKAIDLEGRSL